MPFFPPEGAELVESLGNGTIFDVALVTQEGRLLICKRLTSRALRAPEGRAAIVREAKALDLARHPSIPAIVRLGTDDRGPFLLETRAHGASVTELVEGWLARGLSVPPLLVRHVAHTAIAALAEIHQLCDAEGPIGLVHGDIGPDHLILGPLGQARFVDFGAARFRGMDPELAATRDRGTLPFAAPELARGEVEPSAATDVYALSATLLFLATGKPLCHAREAAAMLAEVGERGLRPELLPLATAFTSAERDAIGRALAFDPDARLKSARALLDGLT